MIKKEQIKLMGKGQLMDLVRLVSKRFSRIVINEIISQNRKISLEESKKEKLIYQKEVRIVLEYLGIEIGSN